MMGSYMNLLACTAGVLCIYCLYRKLCFGNKSFLYTVLTAPAVFFSACYLIDAVTRDEGNYIPVFGNMPSIELGSEIWVKSSYQYRTTQMVLGTILRVLRKISPSIGQNTANILFKAAYWSFFFLLVLVIAYIWGMYVIALARDTFAYRIANLGILYCLIGLPVACLVLKVCNYDAGNIYFAILSFSFILAAERKNDVRLACVGAVLATFGCLEKWTCLIYYMIAVAMTVYLAIKTPVPEKGKRYYHHLKAVMLIPALMLCSSGICILNFLYIRFLSGNWGVDMHIGAMLFPMFYMARVFAGKGEFIVEDPGYYDAGFLLYLFLAVLLIAVTTVLFLILDECNQKIRTKRASLLSYLTTILGFVFIFTGIAGAYLIKRQIFPFVDYPPGVYQPPTTGNEVSYFYGAKTSFGHTVINIMFANASLTANIPTAALAVLIIALILLLKHKRGVFLLQSLFLIAFLFIPLFTLFGQPADARYFGVTTLLIMMCSVYYVTSFFGELLEQEPKYIAFGKSLAVCLIAAYGIEMLINLPIYNCFSPIWLIRSESFRETVRQGEWDAGEAMTWGEELALAGKIIQKEIAQKEIAPNEITIITDYGWNWYTNPGCHIEVYSRWLQNPDKICDSNTYFVFVKFRLYRSEIPEFITDVEPLYKVKIKGETTAWIYNGEQLAAYYSD